MDIIETIKFDEKNGVAKIIDQTLLPTEYKIIDIKNVEGMWDAIKRLVVRGAPLIGIAAAYGVYLGIKDFSGTDNLEFQKKFEQVVDYLASSRPTAVNLFWALNEMKNYLKDKISKFPVPELKQMILSKANDIYLDDLNRSKKIGEYGEPLIKDGFNIMTICNAGGLATSGLGTALAPIYFAHSNGKKFQVYNLETRPLLQGSRLTSWELLKYGVKDILICDNMAASVMSRKGINLIITGADRIASNGDTANKIGTMNLAILAKYFNVPFYVAAPFSTFDKKIKSGKEIPIEERGSEEIIKGFGNQTAPENVDVFNPAFDVTPNELITGIITEKGIIRPPFVENIAKN